MNQLLSFAALVIAVVVAISGVFYRTSLLRQFADRDRRLRAVDGRVGELGRLALKAEENSMRLNGQLALCRNDCDECVLALRAIRTETVSRNEHETRTREVDTELAQVRDHLQRLASQVAGIERRSKMTSSRST